MTATTITRRIPFCAGHRVMGHETKCKNLHGHNFVALVTCTGNLDSIGRVVDFSVIKSKVKGWIDDQWDHGFILNGEDKDGMRAMALVPDQKVYLMTGNPTAENLATLLMIKAQELLGGAGLTVTCVAIEETENCKAQVSLSDHG